MNQTQNNKLSFFKSKRTDICHFQRIDLNLVISKQSSKNRIVFSSKFSFLYTVRQNFSWGTNFDCIQTKLFIFFRAFIKKISLDEKRHVQFSNIFPKENPFTFRLKKKTK